MLVSCTFKMSSDQNYLYDHIKCLFIVIGSFSSLVHKCEMHAFEMALEYLFRGWDTSFCDACQKNNGSEK